MTQKEATERELYSKIELLRTVEEHHVQYAKKLNTEHKEFAKKKNWEL